MENLGNKPRASSSNEAILLAPWRTRDCLEIELEIGPLNNCDFIFRVVNSSTLVNQAIGNIYLEAGNILF